jgi:agmatinase
MRTYAGIPEEFAQYDTAKVVIIPVPYDGTSTWGKGADKGPEAFLSASENMELYDIETDSEVYRRGVWLAPAVTEDSSPEAMVDAVHQTTLKHIKAGKFVTLFGGEHSISIGTMRAFREAFGDITVVQIDAHADLRPEYLGTPCNHACAVYESSVHSNLIQVGIRSMDVSEKEHMDLSKTYFAHNIVGKTDWMQKSIDQMGDKVVITIDLDAFDPSFMPSTGTPEPGGLGFYEVMDYLRMIFKQRNVIGFDIVELAANPDEKSSDFVAAKLYYKMLSYKFEI